MLTTSMPMNNTNKSVEKRATTSIGSKFSFLSIVMIVSLRFFFVKGWQYLI